MAQIFKGLLQMSSEFRVHFISLAGIECKAGEALTYEFLPIRHRSPR
jgi:hypothetical protein